MAESGLERFVAYLTLNDPLYRFNLITVYWDLHPPLLLSGVRWMDNANAIVRRTVRGVFAQVEFVELFFGQTTKQFAAEATAGRQSPPQSLVSVPLIHQALQRLLLRRQIVIRIHREKENAFGVRIITAFYIWRPVPQQLPHGWAVARRTRQWGGAWACKGRWP